MQRKKIKTDGTEHHGIVVRVIASNWDISDEKSSSGNRLS
jgi:hypothetical protein